MKFMVRAAGILSLLIIALAGWGAFRESRVPEGERAPQREVKGVKMPALAMEFVGDVAEVEAFLGPRDGKNGGPMSAKLRRVLYLDAFFIALYWNLYLCMCVILAKRDLRLAVAGLNLKPVLWVFAFVCATVAAAADRMENARTDLLLYTDKITQPLVESVASAAFIKWLLIGLATAAVSFVFYRWKGGHREKAVGRVMFALYLATAALTLGGTLGREPRAVAFAFTWLTAPAVIVLAVLFTFWPRWVSERL